MAEKVWAGRPVNRCANVQCPNRADEEAFTVVTTNAAVVGGHRGITLIMCQPCAGALQEHLSDGDAR